MNADPVVLREDLQKLLDWYNAHTHVTFFTRQADQCPHAMWCEAFDGQRHADTCPTGVLGLTDGDVRAFVDNHCRVNITWTLQGRPVLHLSGDYDGRHASTNLSSKGEDQLDDMRWLAEELLIHAALGTPRPR